MFIIDILIVNVLIDFKDYLISDDIEIIEFRILLSIDMFYYFIF